MFPANPSFARRMRIGKKALRAASTRVPSTELHSRHTRSIVTVPPIASGNTCSRLEVRSLQQKMHNIINACLPNVASFPLVRCDELGAGGEPTLPVRSAQPTNICRPHRSGCAHRSELGRRCSASGRSSWLARRARRETGEGCRVADIGRAQSAELRRQSGQDLGPVLRSRCHAGRHPSGLLLPPPAALASWAWTPQRPVQHSMPQIQEGLHRPRWDLRRPPGTQSHKLLAVQPATIIPVRWLGEI